MHKSFDRRDFLRGSAGLMGAASLGAAVSPQAFAQNDNGDAEIIATDLGYAWAFQGAGCNVLAIPGRSENGCMLIDGGLEKHSDALLAAVFEETGQDRVHTLVNTHWHPEQTGSNERVGAEGGRIIAHEKTKMFLQNAVMSSLYDGRYGPLADAGLPTETIKRDGDMKFAGQEIVYGYLPAAHSESDIFLFFPMLNILVTGGPVTMDRWPVLDIRHGAWMGGLLRAHERLTSLVSATTTVIPAHGRITNGTELMRQRAMYTMIHLKLAEQLNLGMGPDDVVAMNLFKEYEEQFGDNTQFLDHAHRSLQIAYVPD